MSTEPSSELPVGGSIGRTSALVLGLAVFVLGIVLMVFVFQEAFGLFHGIDAQVSQMVQVSHQPAVTPPGAPKLGPVKPVATAKPQATPVLAQFAATLGLKLLGLLVLGWLAALISAKGAQMVAASNRLHRWG